MVDDILSGMDNRILDDFWEASRPAGRRNSGGAPAQVGLRVRPVGDDWEDEITGQWLAFDNCGMRLCSICIV